MCAEFDVEFDIKLCYDELDERSVNRMPKIKPISELRNYSTLLEKVTPGNPIYLIRNGPGAYALADIRDQADYENSLQESPSR